MAKPSILLSKIQERFQKIIIECACKLLEVTVEVAPEDFLTLMQALKNEPSFAFEQLIDVTVVDYLDYGKTEWATADCSSHGFNRGVSPIEDAEGKEQNPRRFAAVYHLLSLSNNHRVRVKVFLREDKLVVDSVVPIWESANWFEREAYDLFGVMFRSHPDLRRILTDYGFVGHPFRKDFPVSGYVEVRYDAEQEQVIYEPVDIEPRVLAPKVIRDDNRYESTVEKK
jgi:NADH-quinone oxidoreductase subunit C